MGYFHKVRLSPLRCFLLLLVVLRLVVVVLLVVLLFDVLRLQLRLAVVA